MKARQLLSTLGKGFLTPTETEFIYGPLGRCFLRNIEANWWKHCVVSVKYNVHPTKISEVSRTLQYLRDIKGDSLPFGLASIETIEADLPQSTVLGLPLPLSRQVMRVMTLGEKTSAKDLFYRKQRERKAWWRKFSSNPSRFRVINLEESEDRDIMVIKAQFPSQDLTVEVISFGRAANCLQESSGRISKSYVVEHTTSLELAFLALLCDGYDQESKSLHIHPKLAPYKAIITFEGTSDEELLQLAVYLNNQLRADSLNTIVSSNNNDAKTFHVPYIISIDNDSLKNGIVRVSNQLTTIGEKVHITDLVRHVAAYCT